MADISTAPDVIIYSAAVTACEKAMSWQQALRILSSMEAAKVLADVVACSAAISACEKCGKWQEALHLLSGARGQPIMQWSEAHLMGRPKCEALHVYLKNLCSLRHAYWEQAQRCNTERLHQCLREGKPMASCHAAFDSVALPPSGSKSPVLQCGHPIMSEIYQMGGGFVDFDGDALEVRDGRYPYL